MLALSFETTLSCGSQAEQGFGFPAAGRCVRAAQGQDIKTYISHHCFPAAPHSLTSTWTFLVPRCRVSVQDLALGVGFPLGSWYLCFRCCSEGNRVIIVSSQKRFACGPQGGLWQSRNWAQLCCIPVQVLQFPYNYFKPFPIPFPPAPSLLSLLSLWILWLSLHRFA